MEKASAVIDAHAMHWASLYPDAPDAIRARIKRCGGEVDDHRASRAARSARDAERRESRHADRDGGRRRRSAAHGFVADRAQLGVGLRVVGISVCGGRDHASGDDRACGVDGLGCRRSNSRAHGRRRRAFVFRHVVLQERRRLRGRRELSIRAVGVCLFAEALRPARGAGRRHVRAARRAEALAQRGERRLRVSRDGPARLSDAAGQRDGLSHARDRGAQRARAWSMWRFMRPSMCFRPGTGPSLGTKLPAACGCRAIWSKIRVLAGGARFKSEPVLPYVFAEHAQAA